MAIAYRSSLDNKEGGSSSVGAVLLAYDISPTTQESDNYEKSVTLQSSDFTDYTHFLFKCYSFYTPPRVFLAILSSNDINNRRIYEQGTYRVITINNNTINISKLFTHSGTSGGDLMHISAIYGINIKDI